MLCFRVLLEMSFGQRVPKFLTMHHLGVFIWNFGQPPCVIPPVLSYVLCSFALGNAFIKVDCWMFGPPLNSLEISLWDCIPQQRERMADTEKKAKSLTVRSGLVILKTTFFLRLSVGGSLFVYLQTCGSVFRRMHGRPGFKTGRCIPFSFLGLLL